MSRQAIGIGAAANDGTGDPLRTAFTKANDNLSEIYTLLGGDTLTIAGARTALGIGTADSPTFAGVTLGALSSIHFTGLTANALLLSDGTDLTQSANLTWGAAAGQGLIATANVATTNVALATFTRQNNNAAVVKGFEIIFDDDVSAAGFLPFQVLGGASAATNLVKLSKSGELVVGAATAQGGEGVTGLYVRAESQLYTGASGIIYFQTRSAIKSSADGLIQIQNNAQTSGAALDFLERTAPAGVANTARIFAQDNGAGKTQLMVIFGSGAAIQLAIEA